MGGGGVAGGKGGVHEIVSQERVSPDDSYRIHLLYFVTTTVSHARACARTHTHIHTLSFPLTMCSLSLCVSVCVCLCVCVCLSLSQVWQCLNLHVSPVCCLRRGYFVSFSFFSSFFFFFFGGGGGWGVAGFCCCVVFLFSVSFCLVCLFSVVCQLFCIGGMCMFIIIPFVMGQVAFYNKTF